MLRSVLSVIAGLGVAVVTFSLFQGIGGLLNPPPSTLDYNDKNAVAAFISSMPISAFLILVAGYIIGSFLAGYLATKLLRSRSLAVLMIASVLDLILVGMVLVAVLAALHQFERLPGIVKTLLPFLIIGVSIAVGFFLGRIAHRSEPGRAGIATVAIIGILLTAAWIMNLANLPHPTWMVIIGLLCFIPPAMLGGHLAAGNDPTGEVAF